MTQRQQICHWLVKRFQIFDVRVVQLNGGGGHQLLELGYLGNPNDRRGDFRFPEQPGNRNLRRRVTVFFCDLDHPIGDIEDEVTVIQALGAALS